MSTEEIQTQAHSCFYFRGQPAISSWLTQKQDSDGPRRLAACGNIVIPKMAELAVSILAKL